MDRGAEVVRGVRPDGEARMTLTVPRIEFMPDQEGMPGFLLIHPTSRAFVGALKELVPTDDLYWSARPAGWWIPMQHRAPVHELTRSHFGYVLIVDQDGLVAHDFYRAEASS